MTNNATNLIDWLDQVRTCKACPLHTYSNVRVTHRYSHGVWDGYSKVDLLFIGEAPGDSEYITGKPFTGPAGEQLNSIIDEAVPAHIRYLITNAVMCTPFMDSTLSSLGTPNNSEINPCRSHVDRLIHIARPKAIIILGEIAKRSFNKIYLGDYYPQVKYVKHPSAIMQSKAPELYIKQTVLAIQEALCL